MNRYPLWKYVLVVITVVLGITYSLPNLFGESPAVQITTSKSHLKIDTVLLNNVEATLKRENVPFESSLLDATGLKIRFADPDTQIRAKDVLQKTLNKDYVIALNLLSRSPEWLRGIGALPMYLGLDLRGGVHFLLEVDMKAALDKAADRYVGDFRSTLRKEKINHHGITRVGQSVQIRFGDATQLEKAKKLISDSTPDLILKESEDGTEKLLTASLSQQAQKNIQESALKQNIHTLHNRINELGVAEPVIQQQGANRVVVQLPGVQDTAKAKEIL